MAQPFLDTSCVDELLQNQVSRSNTTSSQSARNGPNATRLNSTPIRNRNLLAPNSPVLPLAAIDNFGTTSNLANEMAIFAFRSNASPSMFRTKKKHASYSESVKSNQSSSSSFSNESSSISRIGTGTDGSSDTCDSEYSQSARTPNARKRNRLDSMDSSQSISRSGTDSSLYSNQSTRKPKARQSNRLDSMDPSQSTRSSSAINQSISRSETEGLIDSTHYSNQSTRTPKARRRNRLDSSESNQSVTHSAINRRQPTTSRSAQTRAYNLTQPALNTPVNRNTQLREKKGCLTQARAPFSQASFPNGFDSYRRNISYQFERAGYMKTVTPERRVTNWENEISSFQRTENTFVEKRTLNEVDNQEMQEELDLNETNF